MSYNLQDDLQGLREAAKHRCHYEGERLDVFCNEDSYDPSDGSLLIPAHLSVHFDNKHILVGMLDSGRVNHRFGWSLDNGYHRIIEAQLRDALESILTSEVL